MVKVNRELLPVKAHYFFFFAALGPVLPQLNVYGRQLGVSPEAMGLVTAVLPLLWAVAKPCFGYLVDYFTSQRKLIFMLLILVMSGSYCSLWFLPQPKHSLHISGAVLETIHHINGSVYLRAIQNTSISGDIASQDSLGVNITDKIRMDNTNEEIDGLKANDSFNDLEYFGNAEAEKLLQKYICHWDCDIKEHFVIWMRNDEYIHEMYVDKALNNETCENYGMHLVKFLDKIECKVKDNCNLLCIKEVELKSEDHFDGSDNNSLRDDSRTNFTEPKNNSVLKTDNNFMTNFDKDFEAEAKNRTTFNSTIINNVLKADILKGTIENGSNVILNGTASEASTSIYGTVTFWGFVILMCIGTVAFNVANCIGDAVCFDVLGPERASKYGSQRAWGTAGYGATAFLGGWLVDLCSGGAWKDFTPAFVLAAAFTLLDLLSCRRLKLPQLSGPADESSRGALRAVLQNPRVLVFIIFAVIVGMFDSFIIYYLFWYIEELADASGSMESVKLLEGVIVFGQSFVGELLFFFLSGRILTRFGHGRTMTFCLFCYGLRLAFISLVTNPWYLVPIEAVMQGPTYALCYATIVGYAAAAAPEGHSATMQGIVAGMDDGLGFALGSLLGGQLYGRAGGAASFRLMAAVAAGAAVFHEVLHRTVLAGEPAETARKAPGEAAESLEESEKMLGDAAQPGGAVYRDTVLPLHQKLQGNNNAR